MEFLLFQGHPGVTLELTPSIASALHRERAAVIEDSPGCFSLNISNFSGRLAIRLSEQAESSFEQESEKDEEEMIDLGKVDEPLGVGESGAEIALLERLPLSDQNKQQQTLPDQHKEANNLLSILDPVEEYSVGSSSIDEIVFSPDQNSDVLWPEDISRDEGNIQALHRFRGVQATSLWGHLLAENWGTLLTLRVRVDVPAMGGYLNQRDHLNRRHHQQNQKHALYLKQAL
jgi:hypothetical protein